VVASSGCGWRLVHQHLRFLVVTTVAAQRQKVEVTTHTTLSLPLLSFTKGRPGVTTLENLRALSGVGIVNAMGTSTRFRV